MIDTKEYGILRVDENNVIMGNCDFTRWNNTHFFNKLIGFVFRRYKSRFIDIKPFAIKEFKCDCE